MFGEAELHEGLVEENSGEEVEFLFTDYTGLIMFVENQGDPL